MSSKVNKNEIICIFKSCLNILRTEGITGEKALKNLSYLLTLKLIEPHINNTININDFNITSSYEVLDEEAYINDIRYYSKFSNLSNANSDDLIRIILYLWSDLLIEHPVTKHIFNNNRSDIKHNITLKKLIDKLLTLKINNTEYDILGDAYEEIIKDIMTGKILGQFFTPPIVKDIMIKLIDPKIYSNGTIESCCDPTMGTGGFLITYYKYILDKSKKNNIKLDMNFIKTKGIYGKEIDIDTYQLAASNMLISTGSIFQNLDNGDSIREPINKKFDNILANPPFGIKGLKYNDFNYPLKNEYIPIKSDNAVSLFIQAIIYMLKINGKCAIIIPDGQDLFNKSNKTLITIRDYLLRTCDLQEIIYLPSNIFTNTSIKTCIFYFVKKQEGTNILSIKSKKYIFNGEYETKSVKFYNYNIDTNNKELLIDVPIKDIINNNLSLNYSEYIEKEEIKYDDGIIIKKLEDICKFLPKSKRPASYGKKLGQYPFFKSSLKIDSFTDTFDYDNESIIIGDGGEPNINYGIKFSASDHCYILQNLKEDIKLKYVYYYLYNNLHLLDKLYTGAAIKNISKTSIKNIEIPIPPLDKQIEIIKYCENKDIENKKLEETIKNNKASIKTFIIDVLK